MTYFFGFSLTLFVRQILNKTAKNGEKIGFEKKC